MAEQAADADFDAAEATCDAAHGILRRNDTGGYLETLDGRVRALDFRFNEFALSFRRRVDDAERLATLVVKFEGEMVLAALWNVDGFVRRSLKPGPWEDLLRRYDRTPALARRGDHIART